MNLEKLFLAASLCLVACVCFSQDKTQYKFDKIGSNDFNTKVYSIDSNAAAVILADAGSTKFTGNNKGWFTMIFKRRTRIRILKNPAVDLATLRVVLYKKDDDEEVLEDVKGITYNELNGAVVETSLDKKDIFTEKLDKNHTEKKFTMPAVKEGSIVDISYTIKSDFVFNLQPWTFQHVTYPCLWSEYHISVPGLLNYVSLRQGFNKYYIEKRDQKNEVYRVVLPADHNLGIQERPLSLSTTNTRYHWAMKDLPGIAQVDHLTTPLNYVDKIEFQLSQVNNGEETKDVMNTWPKVAVELMKREDFAGALVEDNSWLDKDVKRITDNYPEPLVRAKEIYEFVKRNYTVTAYGFFIKTKLFDVYKSRKGNVGEINLLLIAMLRKAGITADPVLASTRNNGRPHDKYPIVSKYNYVFCKATINNEVYCLDAGKPFLGFGRLDPECYNGNARVISSTAQPINLDADSLKETRNTLIVVNSNEAGVLKASVKKSPGYYQSYHFREEISKKGKENFANELEKPLSLDATISNFHLDSLDDFDKPLGIQYDFTINTDTGSVFYLNPFFGERYEKNLFKSEERLLPVEMDFPGNTTYVVNIEIPGGYIVEELPKSIKVKLNNEGDGIFEYMIQKSGNYISLRSTLVVKRTYFGPGEYDMLREFFNLIIKKQNENIVFKKA